MFGRYTTSSFLDIEEASLTRLSRRRVYSNPSTVSLKGITSTVGPSLHYQQNPEYKGSRPQCQYQHH